MIGRIVEVAEDRRHLSMHRGLMMVRSTADDQKELGQVPLDDIAAVIANAHGLTYTNNLLVALAERSVPFVLCGANHNVVGMLLSVDGHFEQAKRIEAALPLGGRVNVLQFTDKQYERIVSFRGKLKKPQTKTPYQFDLF